MAINLNDQNFEREISSQKVLVLADFFATWCGPCMVLGPVLEKVEKDLEGKIVLAKINVDAAPVVSEKFSIDRIPAVKLFKDGKVIGEFIGYKDEDAIKNWLEGFLKADSPVEVEDGLKEKTEKLIAFYEEHAEANGFKLNPDKRVVERILKGLFNNEKTFGEKYCPCRRVTGNKEDDAKKICPCAWHKEEVEKDGRCFCNLFVK